MVLIEQHGSFTVEAPKFPSPCGDYGSYPGSRKDKHGKIIFVSVPLRGLWFLSREEKTSLKEQSCSFRPLAGIMVLINVTQTNY